VTAPSGNGSDAEVTTTDTSCLLVEAHDEIRNLSCYERDMEIAGPLAQEWCAQI